MRFILKGFTQEMGFRVFEFEKVDEDQTRTAYTISADLALTRRYDIRIQDLPLLCRLSLERHEASDDTRSFIFRRGNEQPCDEMQGGGRCSIAEAPRTSSGVFSPRRAGMTRLAAGEPGRPGTPAPPDT